MFSVVIIIVHALLLLSSCHANMGNIVNYLTKEDHYYSNRPLILDFFQQYMKDHSNSTLANHVEFCSEFHLKQPKNSNHHVKKPFLVYLSTEHTLVAKGGINRAHFATLGHVPTLEDKSVSYFVRFPEKECYFQSDLVIEYSNPNIENIRLSNQFDNNFLKRIVYIPPMPFKYDPYHGSHNETFVITCVIDIQYIGGRRTEIFQKLTAAFANNHHNVVGNNKGTRVLTTTTMVQNKLFNNLTAFQDTMDGTKILVNMHQTPFHRTLEELRIVPALLRGVIVISEQVPLQHTFPFHEFMIFVPYEEIVSTVVHVSENYETYREKFFGKGSKLNETVLRVKQEQYLKFETILKAAKHVV